MNSSPEDRILDVVLSEMLGGEKPPDLTERIIQAMAVPSTAPLGEASSSSPAPATSRLAPIPVSPNGAAPPSGTQSQVGTPQRSSSRSVLVLKWLSAATAASVLLALGVVAMNQPSGTGRQETVQQDPPGQLEDVPPNVDGTQPPASAVADSPSRSEDPTPRDGGVPKPPPTNVAQQPDGSSPRPILPEESTPPESVPPATVVQRPPPPSRADDEVIASIDHLLARRWEEEGVKPAIAASDAEWCRRVFLDVLGRIPTYDEVSRFVVDRAADKRRRLLDHLLESDDYLQEFAQNWTNIWSTLLIGRNGGTDPRELASRAGLEQYLRRAFLKNKSYDQMVVDLVSAEGAARPGEEGFHGAVNFLLDNLQENAVPATAKTARIFLGMQVQCTQCHNHPFNDWKQEQFWSLNAFFRQAKGERGRDSGTVRLIDSDFVGEGQPPSPEEAEIYFEHRNGRLSVAYPVFVDGTAIKPAGWVSQVNRRDELARLIVRSEQMPRALVNRLWAHFLGYGFTKPVDDMGPHNAPSHPELLDQLAQDFEGSGFDLKRLIRWVTLSAPYSLSSRMPRDTVDDPNMEQPPLFSYFYLRQMRAEELYESLLVATGLSRRESAFEDHQQAKTSWVGQFNRSFDTDENDECTTFNGTISQSLVMWNGDLMKQATSGQAGTFLYQVASADTQSRQKLDRLFTAALARKPTPQEVRNADQLWQSHEGDTTAALQDIWWAVLNSNEFIFNH